MQRGRLRLLARAGTHRLPTLLPRDRRESPNDSVASSESRNLIVVPLGRLRLASAPSGVEALFIGANARGNRPSPSMTGLARSAPFEPPPWFPPAGAVRLAGLL